MTQKIEIVARNMRLTDTLKDYIEKKAVKLERHLQEIEEIRVEVSHVKTARSATDRQVAQMTLHGKGFILRTEERADDIRAAFDTAMDKMQRQVERYKGKHYHGRGNGRSAAEVIDEQTPANEESGELLPLIARRKKFIVLPMNEEEAIEQMRLLGHDNFFVFFNAEQNSMQVLYRRRNGTYGLIEPVVG
jgi:putative sigma-54 modulation protein